MISRKMMKNRMNERDYILKNFDIEEIIAFTDQNDVEVIKGAEEGTYIGLINYDGRGEPYATEKHPIICLINGVKNYNEKGDY